MDPDVAVYPRINYRAVAGEDQLKLAKVISSTAKVAGTRIHLIFSRTQGIYEER